MELRLKDDAMLRLRSDTKHRQRCGRGDDRGRRRGAGHSVSRQEGLAGAES